MGFLERLKFMMTSFVVCVLVGTLIFGAWCLFATLSADQMIKLAGFTETAFVLFMAGCAGWWFFEDCSNKALFQLICSFVVIMAVFATVCILPSWLIGLDWLQSLGFSPELAQCSDSLILHAFIGGIFWLTVGGAFVALFLLYVDCVWQDMIKNTIYLLFCLGSTAATIYVENMFGQII